MMDIRVITAIGLGVVAVGVGAITLLPNRQETESKLLTAAQISEQAMQGNTAQTEPENSFQSIAIPPDVTPICSLPKPPRNIGDSALTRNSFGQVMRLIALQKWQESGSCECFYNQISWDDVILEAPKFERTDGIALQFDFPKLLKQADELSVLRSEVCTK